MGGEAVVDEAAAREQGVLAVGRSRSGKGCFRPDARRQCPIAPGRSERCLRLWRHRASGEAAYRLGGFPMRRSPEDRAIVPFPTHAVSNMEWVPTGITPKQKVAERLIAEECATQAKRHGMTRAQFLRTAAATATAFMVLNKLHGSTAFAVRKVH